MIINAFVTDIINFDTYIPDTVFNAVLYDRKNKKVSIKAQKDTPNGMEYSIDFYNVIKLETSMCDIIDESLHILDWKATSKKEQKLISGLSQKSDIDKKYMEIVINLTLNNKLTIACEYILFGYSSFENVFRNIYQTEINDSILSKIEKIFNMIDWNNREDIQQEGIELARQIENIEMFLQPDIPLYSKNIWENCAKILSKKSDEVLKPYLIPLLEWLQDINWPGAFIILDRLKRYEDDESFNQALNNCINKAKSEDDGLWLDGMSLLCEKAC